MNLDFKKASKILSFIGILAILFNYIAYFLNYVHISTSLNIIFIFLLIAFVYIFLISK